MKTRTVTKPMHKESYPHIGENLYRDTLPNGLRVSVMTKPGYARRHAFFATEYGGADRRFRLDGDFIDTPAGVAHFLEHKMFDMPEGDNIMAEFAAMGAQPNAYTSYDMTAYFFSCTDNFDKCLRHLLRFVSTPYYTPESVAKEQGIIGQEIKMYLDEPGSVVFNELLSSLYEHNPIREDIGGTVESIAEITADTLYSCHRAFYAPGNMTLCVVGDVDPEEVRATALEMLPGEPTARPERDYGQAETLMPIRKSFTKAMDVSAPQFMIGCKVPCQARGEAALRQKLLAGAALSYLYSRSSPFYTRLYSEGLLNTEFFTEFFHSNGTATLMAGGESREPQKVMDEFLAEAKKAAEQGLDEALWSRIKKSAYGGRIRALSAFGGLCAAMAEADFGGYNCLDSFRIMEDITAGDVRSFIAENMLPERFTISIIEPLGKEAAQ